MQNLAFGDQMFEQGYSTLRCVQACICLVERTFVTPEGWQGDLAEVTSTSGTHGPGVRCNPKGQCPMSPLSLARRADRI